MPLYTSPHECFSYSFIVVRSLLNKYDKVTKKLKESLSSVTAKLNDANYFLWKKKKQNYFESGDSEK
jgi:hypothetical protein